MVTMNLNQNDIMSKTEDVADQVRLRPVGIANVIDFTYLPFVEIV